MVDSRVGSLDTNVTQARLRARNPSVRAERRNNKKPRKQLPTQKPATQGAPSVPSVPEGSSLEPNISLDNLVEQMRQPSAGLTAPLAEEESYAEMQNMPDFNLFDHKTKAQIRGFIIRGMIQDANTLEDMR